MQLRVLGQIEAGDDGDRRPVGSRNQRIVLAVLASQPGFTASADLLIDAIWGDTPPDSARAALRTYVSRLRRRLGDDLAITPNGYSLQRGSDGIDASRFENLETEAVQLLQSDPSVALDRLDEALGLWRGDPFGDAGDIEPVRPAVARLRACHGSIREHRATALLKVGRHAEAVAAAEELVTEDPVWEEAWAVLVESLAACNRVPEALRAYQRATRTLAEAGLEPSTRLRHAERAALNDRLPEVQPRRLAVPTSSLVGRDADIEGILGLLQNHRIVTLVGPGGVGKTRLALEVAGRIEGRFEWGSRSVMLAGVTDPEGVFAAIAQDLGLVTHGVPPESVLVEAGQLDMLGIIDNCEHVIDAAATAVDVVTAGGPRLRILATSREPLGVDGEHLWPVAPLPTGVTRLEPTSAERDGDRPRLTWAPAHELFLQRARAVRPDFTPDRHDQEAIDALTRRLDGLPLAIEMAAPRVATMSVHELASRLDDELGVVSSRRRTDEPRHRTLSAVVDWSERLLSPPERELFAEMAIFESPVGPDDVISVTGRADALSLLGRLAERSLLTVDRQGNHTRFGMLRTVRDRAEQLLTDRGQLERLAAAHARHITESLVEADGGLRTKDEALAHARIVRLIPDARSAIAWATEHDPALAQDLCGATFVFGQSRRRDDVLAWSADLLPGLDDRIEGPSGARTLAAAAQLMLNRGDERTALERAEQALDVADRSEGGDAAVGLATEVLGDIHMFSGRLDAAVTIARQGFDVAARSGDERALVAVTASLSVALAYAGDHDAAEQALARVTDDMVESPSDRAWLRYCWGEVILDRDPPRALAALDEAIELADSVGNQYAAGVARVSATSLRARTGDPNRALALFAAVINHWRGQGNGPLLATTLRNLVVLLHRLGLAREMVQLLGTTQQDSVSPTFGDEAQRLEEAAAWAQRQLDSDEIARLHDLGSTRTIEEAAVVALDWLTST